MKPAGHLLLCLLIGMALGILTRAEDLLSEPTSTSTDLVEPPLTPRHPPGHPQIILTSTLVDDSSNPISYYEQKLECQGEGLDSLARTPCPSFLACQNKLPCLLNGTCSYTDRITHGQKCSNNSDCFDFGKESLKPSSFYMIACKGENGTTSIDYLLTMMDDTIQLTSAMPESKLFRISMDRTDEVNGASAAAAAAAAAAATDWGDDNDPYGNVSFVPHETVKLTCWTTVLLIKAGSMRMHAMTRNGSRIPIDTKSYADSWMSSLTNSSFRVSPDLVGISCSGKWQDKFNRSGDVEGSLRFSVENPDKIDNDSDDTDNKTESMSPSSAGRENLGATSTYRQSESEPEQKYGVLALEKSVQVQENVLKEIQSIGRSLKELVQLAKVKKPETPQPQETQ